MYQLAIIEDKLTCTPDQMLRDPAEVLIEQIEAKYSNKIILNVGLGIAFYDFIQIGEPYLYPGSGSSIQIVRFRLIVFRPFVGEVIIGKVLQSNKDGIRLSLEFFDDILIPSNSLQHPSYFNPISNLWIWKYETGEESTSTNEFPLAIGETVRFKVRTISFTELTASARGLTATTITESQDIPKFNESNLLSKQTSNPLDSTSQVPLIRRRSSSTGVSPEEELPAAMQIIGSMNDFGLGSLGWW